jgi:hypothetical protein
LAALTIGGISGAIASRSRAKSKLFLDAASVQRRLLLPVVGEVEVDSGWREVESREMELV